MKKITFFLVILFLFFTSNLFAQTSQSQQKKDLESQILEYQKKLNDLKQQKNTLSSQIQYMDTQVYLTTLQINETEQRILNTGKEIDLIGSRIDRLDQSLDYLSKQLIQRVIEGYKKKRLNIFSILFDNEGANDLLNKVKYLKTAQDNNQKLLFTVQEAKTNYEEQKKLREEKKVELDKLTETLNGQKLALNNQKVQKQRLLADTNNDEVTYQSLLIQAQAEYKAIQGIITGAGTETKLGDIKMGETIATVIPGSSCNSGGSHTHFIVKENGAVMNPFNYLKSVSFSNCSGTSCDSGDGDQFNPSGSWEWPLNPSIKLEQGFGSTWAVRNTWVGRIYSFHNGIDINGASNDVLAVSDGTIYKGVYSVGCALSYVKLVHKGTNVETYYLHVYSK
jgi:peptidoglycan hydrolase CwlO-like protein